MLNANRRLFWPKTSETEHWLSDACGAQFDSLFWKCDAKPVGAFVSQMTRTCDGSVSVCICFDHSHHASHRAHALPNAIEVCGKVVEIDLGPRRALGESVFQVFRRRHGGQFTVIRVALGMCYTGVTHLTNN